MKKLLVILIIGAFLVACEAGRRHRRGYDDDSDGYENCECNEDDYDKDYKRHLDNDKYDDMTEKERQEWRHEHMRKQDKNDRCCEKHWEKKRLVCILVIASVIVVAIVGVTVGCCCYQRKCKKQSRPDEKYSAAIIEITSEPSGVSEKQPLPEGNLVAPGSVPPTYSTIPSTAPMYGDTPRDLVLTPPPPYSTTDKMSAVN